MNYQIILAGLKARPVRTAVGILAVTLEVVLILLLVGLTDGAISDTGSRVAGVGGEIIIKAPDSTYYVGFSSAALPVAEMGGSIAKVEGIKAVAPVVTQTQSSGGFTMIWGIDPPSFDAMSGGFKFIQGRMFAAPDEAIIDDRISASQNIHVGDPIMFLNRSFKVTGVVENGKGARIFIPIGTAQEMLNRPGFATMFYVKLVDKSKTKEIIPRLKDAIGDYDIVDADEWLSLMYSANASLLGVVFNVIVLLGVAIGVMVIFLSMYTTVTERTREIGILRAMGGSKTFIVLLIIEESLALCVLGSFVGIGSSFLLMFLLKKIFSTLNILITTGWIIRATGFALLSGVVGSLYPAYKAASQDPIEALAYE